MLGQRVIKKVQGKIFVVLIKSKIEYYGKEKIVKQI